jgi:protein-disulfide isomerase
MPSGKRARQQRQAAVPRPPAGGAGGLDARQASPRTLAIAGGVIALVIVAVVLGIVLSSGSSAPNASYDGPTIGVVIGNGIPAIGKSSTSPETSAADVAKMFAGIPQQGLTLGLGNAPVTLTEFLDFQCPNCQQFELTELPDLIKKYVRTGKLRIVMKPWSILDKTPDVHDSARGQKATIAASFQNKAFNFASVLYNNQGPEDSGWMNDGAISNIAAAVDGLDLQKLANDANSSQTATIVHQVDSLATQLAQRYPPNQNTGAGFGGTPGIFLSKGIGAPVLFGDRAGVPQLSALEAEIARLAK